MWDKAFTVAIYLFLSFTLINVARDDGWIGIVYTIVLAIALFFVIKFGMEFWYRRQVKKLRNQ